MEALGGEAVSHERGTPAGTRSKHGALNWASLVTSLRLRQGNSDTVWRYCAFALTLKAASVGRRPKEVEAT